MCVCVCVCVCLYVYVVMCVRPCLYTSVLLCVLMCDKLLDLFLFVFAIDSIIIVFFERVYYEMGNKRVGKKTSRTVGLIFFFCWFVCLFVVVFQST